MKLFILILNRPRLNIDAQSHLAMWTQNEDYGA